MSYYIPDDCADESVDPKNRNCPVNDRGDVQHFFVAQPDFTFTDITNNTEWINAINDRDVYVMNNTRGTFTITSETTEGFGGQQTTHDTFTLEWSVDIQDYQANALFVDFVRKQRWKIGFVTESFVHISDGIGTLIGTNPVEDKNQHYWNMAGNCQQINNILPFDRPTIFDTIIDPV